MATATNKKTSKKPDQQPANQAEPAASKAKAVTGTAAKTSATTPTAKRTAAAASAPKTVAKTKGKQSEPERSSPAMAVVDKDVLEFIAAIDDFKRVNGRPFPSWSEVLLVVRQLGYKRK
ncbi:MAG: hypothetical protein ACI85K_002068 [Hyphomicrobiaceae bacterium]|jgi:hypothetical protein